MGASSCLGFCSLPGPLQTVQRAELWGVMLALQAINAVHLGVDNLNVVRYGGRLLDGLSTIRPFELIDDGDLIILIRKLLSIRGGDTVCISKVKGNADENLVRNGQVRALELMKLLTLVVVGSGLMLLMLGGIFLVSVDCGILLFCSCNVSLLPFLVLSLIATTLLVWPLILLFDLLGAFLRGAASLMLFETLLWFQVLFIFWVLIGLVSLLLLFLLLMLFC